MRLVKSREIEKEIRDAVKKDQIIIDTERERADAAEIRADEAEKNAKEAREELAKYIAKYGELK